MFKKFHTRTGLLHDVGQTVNDLGGLLGSVLDPDGTTGSTTPKPDSNTGTSGNEEGSGSLNPSSSVAPAVPSSQMPPSAESSPTPTVQTSNSQNVAPAGSPILSSTSGSPSGKPMLVYYTVNDQNFILHSRKQHCTACNVFLYRYFYSNPCRHCRFYVTFRKRYYIHSVTRNHYRRFR